MAPTRTSHKTERRRELENIRKDIDSLRSNVVALSRTLKEDVTEEAIYGIDKIREKSHTALERAEESVKLHPGRAMFAAFLGGLLASAVIRQ